MGFFDRLFSTPSPLRIGKVTVGSGFPSLIVAEIGTSHGGDIVKAGRLIKEAAQAGATCAKFQAVFADEIVHPQTGEIDLPGGATPLFNVFRSLERDRSFYAELKRMTEEAGLLFLCTPFGLKSASILRDIGVEAVKIASPEINHIPLLTEIATWGIPVLLSTGMSTLADIEMALAILPPATIILHCVTSYPAPEEETNALCLPSLSVTFGKLTGISDHSLEPGLVPALAAALGGCVVEKHFTHDRDGGGLDDPVALPPAQFSELTRIVRAVEALPDRDRLSFLYERYGADRVTALMGTGVKKLAKSEREYYRTTNRSILAVKQIRKGAVIGPDAIALLRSETNLVPGLPPQMLPHVLGRKAARNIDNGTGVTWDGLLGLPQ